MSVALLFPGQGAQTPGFLHALPEHAAVRATLTEASLLLGQQALSMDTALALSSTVSVQLALLTAGVAFSRFLSAEGVSIAAAAGMSVGAFAAAVAAGALSFPAALHFVKRRAELMEQASPSGSGLAVIEGLREPSVRSLLQGTSASIANFNSPTQFVLAGTRVELEQLVLTATDAGAHTARLLATATSSHTSAFAQAAEQLQRFALTLHLQDAQVPIYSNRSARAQTRAAAVREDLAWNMAEPVRWHDISTALAQQGTTLFLEAPPGHTLTRLAKDAWPDIKAYAAAEVRWDILVREARRASR